MKNDDSDGNNDSEPPKKSQKHGQEGQEDSGWKQRIEQDIALLQEQNKRLIAVKTDKGTVTQSEYYSNLIASGDRAQIASGAATPGVDWSSVTWPLDEQPSVPADNATEAAKDNGVQAIVCGILTKLSEKAETDNWPSFPDPRAYKTQSFGTRKPDVVSYKQGLTGSLGITFFGDLKGRGQGDFTNEQKGHILDMARKFMELVGIHRPFLIVFLSDGKRWQFFRVMRRQQDNLIFQEEPVIDDSTSGWKRFVALLRAKPSMLGYSFPSLPHVQLISVLGRGGSAVVYEAKYQSENVHVLAKVFFPDQEASFKAESEALVALNGTVGVPQLKECVEVGNNTGSRFFRTAIIATPIGTRFDQSVNGSHLGQLVRIVQTTHLLGLIHRDIKPENLYSHQNMMLLIDWSSAIKKSDPSGATNWEGTPGFSVSPRDPKYLLLTAQARDLVSVVRTAYSLLFGEHPPADNDQTTQFWDDHLRPGTVWAKARDYAESEDYNSLAKLLETLK